MNEEYDKYYKKGGSYELPTEIFNDLLEQLETHKQKEDKIKRIAKDCLFPDEDYAEVMDVGNRILEILNEGGKE